jgi:hexosaminidase
MKILRFLKGAAVWAAVALLSGAAFLSSCAGDPLAEKPWNQGINVSPTPAEMTTGEGNFSLNKGVVFVAADADVKKVAEFFAARIAASTGFTLPVADSKPSSGYIALSLDPATGLGDEGYALDVTPEAIEIRATTAKGAFYAMQTVMQLLPAEIESHTPVRGVWTIPAVTIRDTPRFAYRGMHLDVCRHFVDVDFVKKQLDLLAMFKINTFHWHLTDDQGWRIEIKKYPRLTEVGSRRIEGEGNEYGPWFYTQDQVREVVAYARERFIEVIPEIELPGHAVAAIHAYPELSCRGEQIPVRNIWGVANDVFCAGNEQVFTFLEDVIGEVIPLFESQYFHIGGDECPKGRWEECPKCQALIRELGLKDDAHNSAEMKLQSWFVQRIGKFLEQHNKKMIGWDEILEGGLAPSAIVMSWRGEQGGIEAANMEHDVIMTPGEWMYLDKYQGDSELQPVTIGGYLPLAKVYGYDPLPATLPVDKHHHILGAQSNIWTEYKYTGEGMEHDIWPRIIATAELTWTPLARKNYADFERRLDNQRVRLDMHGVNYSIPMPEDVGAPSCNFVAFVDNRTLEFSTTEPVKMVYTVDGSEPTASSTEYTGPLTFNETTTLKIRSVLVSGQMSPVRTIELEKQSYAPAAELFESGSDAGATVSGAGSGGATGAGATGGVIRAEYFKGNRRTVAELDGLTPDEVEYVEAPYRSKYRVGGYREVYPDDFWSTVLTGHISIPTDGVYFFNTDHELWIDGKLLISNDADNHATARRFSRSDRSVALAAGPHEFKLVRMGAIFGGWPSQWDNVSISIRPDDQPTFKPMTPEWFK